MAERKSELTRPKGRPIPYLLILTGIILVFGLFANFAANTRSYFNSDYTESLLAAEDILHGHNIILHNWVFPMDNFYITDTLFYVLLGPLIHNNLWKLLHIPAIVAFALAAIAVLLVAKASKAGSGRYMPAIFAAMMLGALDLNGGGPGFLVSDQHAATILLGLVALFCLQCAENPGEAARSWIWPTAFGVTLTLAAFSDPFSLIFLGLPLAIYLGLRLISGTGWRQPAMLFVINALSLLIGGQLIGLIRRLGGFTTLNTMPSSFAELADLPGNLVGGTMALLHLFGAYLFGKPINSLATLVGVFDLLLLITVLFVTILTIARNLRAPAQPNIGLALALSILVLGAADLSSKAFAIAVAGDLVNGGSAQRYLAPIFVMGVTLVAIEVWGGRLKFLNPPALRAFQVLLLAGALAHLATTSAFNFKAARTPPVALGQPEYMLGQWLSQHGLTHGVGDYWEANAVTALTEGKVVVRSGTIDEGSHRLVPYDWAGSKSWRSAFEDPQFVVFKTPNDFRLSVDSIQGAGLSAAQVEKVGIYTVVVLSAKSTSGPPKT